MSHMTDPFCKPWLPDTWGKRDIIFPNNEGDNYHSIVIQTPLITKHFSAPTSTAPSRQPTDSIGLPSPEVRNQSIFALGIILIELWYNRPIENLRITEDFDKNGEVNQITDFATARRLTEEIYREAGDWHNDLNLSSMREAVYQAVLAPLEESLRSFCGGAADELLA
ncbi:MAG: hypothetical protein Q9195_005498 [Heterodermia aff. obscurata]